MKTKHLNFLLAAAFMLASTVANAQGWNQDRNGIYTVGVGGTSVINVGGGFSGVSWPGLSLNVSGEYRVHRFVGVGFETGVDVFPHPYYYNDIFYHGNPSIGIPIGIKTNVHILEAANVPIASRLDVYAGLNIGGGPAFLTAPGGGVYGFIQVGPQFGIRYWVNHSLAVMGEFGWGATFANVGLSF